MITRFKLILILCFLLLAGSSNAEELRKRPFKGFSIIHSKFQSMCEAMKDDGHLDKFIQIILAHAEREAGCEACRPLMKELGAACKSANKPPKEKKVSKKEEAPPPEAPVEGEVVEEVIPTPTNTPYIIQREPSSLVLDRVTAAFGRIAQDETINVGSIPAVQKLLFLLRDKMMVKPGAEQEYFDILAEYISANFRDLIEEESVKAPEEEPETHEDKEKNLGSMFGDE